MCDFVEPLDGLRLQAGLRGIVWWVDNFDLYLNSIAAPLYPTYAFFFPFCHDCSLGVRKKHGDEFRSATLPQPGPDRLNGSSVC